MAFLDDVLNAIQLAAATAHTKSTQAQAAAATALTQTDTAGNQCGEGFTQLDSARGLAESAKEQAGIGEALLTTLTLGTFPLPPPTPTQVITATTSRDAAVNDAQAAEAAIAAAEPGVRANYIACVTKFVSDTVKQCATDQLAAATTADMQADTQISQALAVADTAPNCAEGLNLWLQAEKQVRLAEVAHGDAQSCLNVLQAGLATGSLFPINPADVATITNKVGQVATKLTHAQTRVDDAFPIVLLAHDVCERTLAVVQPIIDCINSAMAAASAATTDLSDPRVVGQPTDLASMIQRFITKADQATPSPGFCNEGVDVLGDAGQFLKDKIAAANLASLQGCLSQLEAAAPGNPLIATGQATLTQAQNRIDAATTLLNGTTGQIFDVWKKRLVCSITTGSVTVHVTDESGDNLSDGDDGLTVSVLSIPINTVLPVDFPVPMASPVDSSSNVTISGVPMAPIPIPAPPATAPPPPPSLPSLPGTSLLTFIANGPGKPSANNFLSVGSSPPGFVITVNVPDTSYW